MRRLALVPLLTVGLLLFPPAASALGLGEIEMQSALNERLDAEIPLRGLEEDERDRVIVTLASEEAFRQVGLQRPFALTRLQFQVKQHANGQFYVHITSREPIVEPFLTFLIEVDWPGGNLLREYTVLLDPPMFVSEGQEPAATEQVAPEAISAAGEESMPAAGVPAAVERAEPRTAEPTPEPEPEPEPEAIVQAEPEPEPEPAAEPEVRRGDFSDTPVFLQVEQEAERAEAEARDAAAAEPVAAPEPAMQAATPRAYEAGPQEYGPVQRGENLWNIASRLKRADMTVQQMMLALLRYNRQAFIEGNINRLKQGYVLRIPDAESVLSLSAQQAVAQVREHNALWREFKAASRSGVTTAAEAPAAEPETTAPEVTGEEPGLTIVGAEEGAGASSDESASATAGTAQAVDEELKLTREQLESARMEKDELQSRVNELEETVAKMERLIEVRQDQLARLQEQLSNLQQEQLEPVATGEVEDTADPAAAPEDEPMEAVAQGGEEPPAGEPETAPETGPETTAAAEPEGPDTAEAAGDAAPAAAEEPGAGDAADETVVAEAEPATAPATAADEAPEPAAEADSGVVTVRTEPPPPGWLDRAGAFWDSVRTTVIGLFAGAGVAGLMQNPLTLPIAGGAVVLLLLAGLLLARRRRAGDEEAIEVGAGGAAVVDSGGGEDEEDQFAALLQTEPDDDVAVEEEADEGLAADTTRADTDEEAESTLMAEDFDLDDLDREEQTTSSGAAEDETLAEADVYLAYGLHQQAEDLLKLALQEQPDRLDYHAKMLETLYGAGKSDEFVARAEDFRSRVEDPGDSLWLKTVAMGKELAPDNPMFQQEVDEKLKPAESAPSQPPGTDFEVGGEGEDATDLDFSLGDEDSDRGTTAEEDDEEFSRTVMVDADELEGAEETEETSAEGEMDFDLGDFASEEGATADEPAEEADFEFDLGELDVGEGAEETAAAEAGGSDEAAEVEPAGEEEFEIDLADLEESGATSDDELADATEAEPLDVGDIEFEGDTDAADEGTVAIDTGDETSLDELEGELATGDTGVAGGDAAGDEDEFDTMLDLARAYIDMGDSDSARAALEEVAESGNDKQRNEAQSLLESV